MATATNPSSRQKTVLILSYAPSVGANGKISAHEIFQTLMDRQLWYCARPSPKLAPAVITLFYESGSGFRGYATVNHVAPTSQRDEAILRRLGITFLKIRLDLSDINIFPQPVPMRPLVDRLDFVANKEHWGHSVRITPREIANTDFETVVRFSNMAH